MSLSFSQLRAQQPHAPSPVLQTSRRRALLGVLAMSCMTLSGCGFALRGTQQLSFESARISGNVGTPVAQALIAALERSGVRVATGGPVPVAPAEKHVVIALLGDQRERVVTGQTAAGQVREMQLRSRLTFQVSNAAGRVLQEASEVLVQRDISYNEADALAKQSEESMLFNDMTNDVVQQLLRRLGKVVVQ